MICARPNVFLFLLALIGVAPNTNAALAGRFDFAKALPRDTVAIIVVDDLRAATTWRQQHAGKDDQLFRDHYRLPGISKWVATAARIERETSKGGTSESLVLVARSDDDALQIEKALLASSPVAPKDIFLARYPSTETLPSMIHARTGIYFVAAVNESAATQLLESIANPVESHPAHNVLMELGNFIAPLDGKNSVHAAWWRSRQGLFHSTLRVGQAERHGLNALTHAASFSSLTAEGTAHTLTRISAQTPLHSTLLLGRFASQSSISCPAWMTDASGGWTVFQCNLGKALRQFGALFDDLYAQGIYGTFDDVLIDARDPRGLDTDLEKELFNRLAQRCVLGRIAVEKAGEPKTFTALEIKPEHVGQVANVIKKLMQDDPEVRQVSLVEGEPFLWSYPADDGLWSGVVVIKGWLCMSGDEGVLRALSQASQKTIAPPLISISPPHGLPLFSEFGAVLTPEDALPKSVANPLDVFFEWSLERSNNSATKLHESPLGHLLEILNFTRGTTWIRFDKDGWIAYSAGAPKKNHREPSRIDQQ